MLKDIALFSLNIGDEIVDTRNNKVGIIKKLGQTGNYSIIYVDFGRGLRKIIPMHDSQTEGRYKKEVQ